MNRSRFGGLLLAALVVVGLVPVAASAQAAGSRVGNRVWDDLDGNGRQDPGEPGLAGVTVELLDATDMMVESTTTGAKGKWFFEVDAGVAWKVRLTAPGGRVFTTRDAAPDAKDSDADAGGIIDIPFGALTAGVADLSFDAGVVPTVLAARIGDRVWDDADGNGRQTPGEPGLAGVTVELLGAHEVVLDTTVTNGRGKWWFIVDAAGYYQVRVTAPEGRVFTAQDVGGDHRDSDADAGGLIPIGDGMLAPGSIDSSFDAGFANEAPLFDGNAGGVTLLIDAAENQTAVTDLEATDADGDTEGGGGLTYALTLCCEGTDNALFALDTATGVLTFLAAPDFENPGDDLGDNLYLVQATVTDSGGLFDVQDISVTVTDVAETLEITSDGGGATAAIEVPENTTAVTDVDAVAPNGDTEGDGLTYTLTGGGCVDLRFICDVRVVAAAGADNDLFTLDADTGMLTFAAAPDFESPGDLGGGNDYQVQVTVTDSEANTDTQDLTITVTDVDEPTTGTITVTLTAFFPGPDVITFSEDITAVGTFMLDDDSASEMLNTITFENVAPGTYSVSRAPFSLLLLGDGCSDSDAGGVDSVMDLDSGQAVINLEAGETVACTFLGIFE